VALCSYYAIIKAFYCPHLFFGQFSGCKIHFAACKPALFSRNAAQLRRREDFSLGETAEVQELEFLHLK